MRLFPSNESDSDANLDLVAVSGPAEGMRVHLDGQESVYLGRDHASIQIPDRMVSLRHCEIRFTNAEGYLVRDMGTVAGTFVNGVRVRRGEERLNIGDELTVGETVFQVVSRQGEVVQRLARRLHAQCDRYALFCVVTVQFVFWCQSVRIGPCR